MRQKKSINHKQKKVRHSIDTGRCSAHTYFHFNEYFIDRFIPFVLRGIFFLFKCKTKKDTPYSAYLFPSFVFDALG